MKRKKKLYQTLYFRFFFSLVLICLWFKMAIGITILLSKYRRYRYFSCFFFLSTTRQQKYKSFEIHMYVIDYTKKKIFFFCVINSRQRKEISWIDSSFYLLVECEEFYFPLWDRHSFRRKITDNIYTDQLIDSSLSV